MSSYPSSTQVPPVIDGQANGFAGTNRTVDWTGYPTLFRRETSRGRHTTIQADAEPVRATRPGRDIREAFLGYCQAMLLAPGTAGRIDRPSERSAAAQALAAAEAFGFTREEIRRIGCGLYPSAAAVREHLRGVGFGDAEIDAANLVCDGTGRPRAELAGSLIVPLVDERGRTRDYLLAAIDQRQSTFASYRYLWGTASTEIAAHGLQAALSRPASRSSLVLVEDLLDGLLLQCRGFHGVVAIGGRGREFSPHRWEELAGLGITSVTLAFRRDGRHAMNIRDALVNALRARTTPEVYVADVYPAGEEGLLDVLRRFGRESCAAAIANHSLAFHDKDFGAERDLLEDELEEPEVVVEEPHYRTAFRQHLAELIAALPEESRPAYTERVAAVDEAIRGEDWERLRRLVGEVEPRSWFTWSTNHRPASREGRADAATVLERLGEGIRTNRWFRPASTKADSIQPPAIEWLVHESSGQRLTMLCEQILDACEEKERMNRRLIVACHEHTDEEIMLALTTRLAGRMVSDAGPTTEEVRRRLAGSTPRAGTVETPWLIDEAVERLRNWSHRLEFVNCREGRDPWAVVEKSVREPGRPSGETVLFLDGCPGESWNARTEADRADWLKTLNRWFAGKIFATSAWPQGAGRTEFQDLPASEAQIRQVLLDWERRELDVVQG